MSELSPKRELLVIDISGTPRSGKGTMVKDFAGRFETEHPDIKVVIEETGKDYRAITRNLLDRGVINTKMDKPAVQTMALQQPLSLYQTVVAERQASFARRTEKPFYDLDVNKMVGMIGSLPMLRGVVKKALQARIAQHVAAQEAGRPTLVMLDGRNLSKVVEGNEGTRIIMRSFIECGIYEAALRESADQKTYLSAKGHRILDSITQRLRDDEERAHDPAVADIDAQDYWAGADAQPITKSVQVMALRAANDRNSYLEAVRYAEVKPLKAEPLHGRGAYAVINKRQVRLDTTPFRAFENPKDVMLDFSYEMFAEAVAQATRF